MIRLIILAVIGGIALLLYFWLPKVELREKPSLKEADLGIIADTHATQASEISEKALQVFKEANVKRIVHAGDFISIKIATQLKKIAPLMAVKGNMDLPEIKFPKINSLEIKGKKIGIIHNAGTFIGLGKALKIAKSNNFDILIFGHTHKQRLEHKQGILLLNPGSAAQPLPPILVKPSIALLKINKKINVEFIEL